MDSVCGRKQAGKVEGNSCLSADAAEASKMLWADEGFENIILISMENKMETNRI